MQVLNILQTVTMTSRQIAELVESRHDDVKRSIERLVVKGVIQRPPMAEVKNHLGQSVFEYQIGKRDSYIIVAQLSPGFTARLVDRWQELELKISSLPDFTDPVASARAWADQTEGRRNAEKLAIDRAEKIEIQALQIEIQKPAVEFVDRYVEASGLKGFREVCKLIKANEARFREFLIDAKIMYRLGGSLTAHQNHIDSGRFEVRTGVAESEHSYTTTKFTTKGVKWIAGEWAKHQLDKSCLTV